MFNQNVHYNTHFLIVVFVDKFEINRFNKQNTLAKKIKFFSKLSKKLKIFNSINFTVKS